MTTLTVRVATVEHRYGIDTYVDLTDTGLRQQIHQYVKRWWEELVEELEEDLPMPEDRDEAIERYFMNVPGEFITWGEAELEI